MIPQSFVQDLLARVDIVDIIDPLVPLKRAGANMVACCPFHSEKTPSFSVSPGKQFYHCFGCGAHGSAISFLMEHLGLGFIDAVKELAGRIGMQVPEVQSTPHAQEVRSRIAGLLPVMQVAQQYYRAQLRLSERAIAYLKGRGLSGVIAARYGIGYAPDAWQNLEHTFERYDHNDLAEAGLVIDNEGGRRYDRFRDRIMFPICDVQGRVIGFGGRVLDSGEPKYLNSPETPLFEKGREVYGLFQARQAIRSAGKVIVVEGYMDVVALAQYGVQYAVATLGTATTPIHVQKLLRLTDEIVFCFDGDSAGRKAAWRALENSLGEIKDGKQIKFLFLPEEDDPDSYIRKNGREGFERILTESAEPLSVFALRELTSRVDMNTVEGKARFLQEAKPLLAQVAAPMLGLMLRKRIAEVSGLGETEATRELQLRPPLDVRNKTPRSPQLRSPFRRIIELLTYRPALLGSITDLADLGASVMDLIEASPPEVTLFRAILQTGRGGSSRTSIGEEFRDTTLEALAQDVEKATFEWEERGLDDQALQYELEGYLRAIRDQIRKAKQKQLMETLSQRRWTDEEKELFRQLQQPVT